ncbi:Carboxylesterase family-domain-containing protein, partial [Pholiota molesta]
LGPTTLTGADFGGVEFFGAIPFTKPPIGALRLQAPVLTTSLVGGTFHASSFGPACLQGVRGVPVDTISEDCLQLNVLRPSGVAAADARLSIVFWIYGGTHSLPCTLQTTLRLKMLSIGFLGGGFTGGYLAVLILSMKNIIISIQEGKSMVKWPPSSHR